MKCESSNGGVTDLSQACWSTTDLGASGEPTSQRRLQQLSELRQGHVIWDETLTATGKAFLRRVANDVSGLSDRLDEAPTAALLAWHLDGDG
jgi:hypothetical protein